MPRNTTPATYSSGALDAGTLGPAMRALNPRQQAFVDYVVTTGTKTFTEAAREHEVDPAQAKKIILELTGQESSSGIPADRFDVVLAAFQRVLV